VGKRIKTASAIDDPNVFGKVGTSGKEVEAALEGKKVSFQTRSSTSLAMS
jgi:formamidopyrimidine-DNA glycosylase